MNQKQKKVGIIIAITLALVILLIVVANLIIENKIASAFEDLPESVKVDYASIDANVLTGNLELVTPSVTVTGETTDKTILDAKLNTIKINDISYWDFIFKDKISVEELRIDQLIAKYKHNPVVQNDDYESGFLDKIKQIIDVEKINITNADLLVTNYDTDSIIMSVPKLNFELNDLLINPKASKKEKKIDYKDFKLTAINLKWAINKFDELFADSIRVTNNNATFKNFKLKTKYDRAEYSNLLKTERDHFDLNIKEVELSNMDFGFNDAEQFYFKSKNVHLIAPETEIYRDKLVADDKTYKPLYGTMLRNLNFELGLNTVEISEGKISYLEKVKSDKKAGRLDFTDMNATIENLGNTYGEEETVINVNTSFMEVSPLEVNWNFKVSDTTDQFIFKADLGYVNAAKMDQFTQPNLNIDFNGELKQTYFTINGNPRTSRVDLKMKYDDFEVVIMQKDGKEKNKFLSTIANLFVSKDSESDKDAYRYGHEEGLERDVTKSVFNFVWINVREGLLSAMTGDGKKKE
ncbi:hypothetical protein [Winogradskyella forsetii]|uniref:hypothetical protein n=1 Tax=Winogradskyella forsetii TaxID=2686077 RepID=UPI0015B89084|nr:hypothetical protein [Winogradskyella forsetii]